MHLWEISKEYSLTNIIIATLMIIFLLLPIASICSEKLGYSSLLLNTFNCSYKKHMGESCPTCGLTRSILSLYKGHLQESVAYNPYGYLFFLLMVIELCLRIFPIVYKRLWIPYLDIAQMFLCGLILRIFIGNK
jgi:hypothetical protein